MKKWSLFGAMLVVFLCGCYSNFTRHMLYAPKTLTVVTPDGIQGNKVYEIENTYYAKATVSHYKLENNIFRSVFITGDDYTCISSDSDKWVSIPQEIQKYLCTAPVSVFKKQAESVSKNIKEKTDMLKAISDEEKELQKLQSVDDNKLKNIKKRKVAVEQELVRLKAKLSDVEKQFAEQKKLDGVPSHKNSGWEPGYYLKRDTDFLGTLLENAPILDKANISKSNIHEVKCMITNKSTFFRKSVPTPFVLLQTKEEFRYYLIPLTLITLPVDIVATVLINVPPLSFFVPTF